MMVKCVFGLWRTSHDATRHEICLNVALSTSQGKPPHTGHCRSRDSRSNFDTLIALTYLQRKTSYSSCKARARRLRRNGKKEHCRSMSRTWYLASSVKQFAQPPSLKSMHCDRPGRRHDIIHVDIQIRNLQTLPQSCVSRKPPASTYLRPVCFIFASDSIDVTCRSHITFVQLWYLLLSLHNHTLCIYYPTSLEHPPQSQAYRSKHCPLVKKPTSHFQHPTNPPFQSNKHHQFPYHKLLHILHSTHQTGPQRRIQ